MGALGEIFAWIPLGSNLSCLVLVRNDQKINFQTQGVIEPVHSGSSSILKVRFLGHPVVVMNYGSASPPVFLNGRCSSGGYILGCCQHLVSRLRRSPRFGCCLNVSYPLTPFDFLSCLSFLGCPCPCVCGICVCVYVYYIDGWVRVCVVGT